MHSPKEDVQAGGRGGGARGRRIRAAWLGLGLAALVVGCRGTDPAVARRGGVALGDPGDGPESAPAEAAETVVRRVLSMGTWLDMRVEGPDRAICLRASEAALVALEVVEARLSTWRDDSELLALNRAPVGQWTPLSPELHADLTHAQELWRITEGLFDPGIGPLLEAWGVRSGGQRPDEAPWRAARAASGLRHLELAPGAARRLHEGLRLEEGGFGKGIGLDAALAAGLEAGAQALQLDLGGQVSLARSAPEPGVWVPLADPRDRGRAVLELRLVGGSLATSGNSERGFELGGERRSHLIDPRTGEPAFDLGSLSVWAPTGVRADALSTALYLAGPVEALRRAQALGDTELVFLQPDGAGLIAHLSPGWDADDVRALVPELELRFAGLDAAPGPQASTPLAQGGGDSAGRRRSRPITTTTR